MGLVHTSVLKADPKQMKIFHKQTPNRPKADLGSAVGICFGVNLCLVGIVSIRNAISIN